MADRFKIPPLRQDVIAGLTDTASKVSDRETGLAPPPPVLHDDSTGEQIEASPDTYIGATPTAPERLVAQGALLFGLGRLPTDQGERRTAEELVSNLAEFLGRAAEDSRMEQGVDGSRATELLLSLERAVDRYHALSSLLPRSVKTGLLGAADALAPVRTALHAAISGVFVGTRPLGEVLPGLVEHEKPWGAQANTLPKILAALETMAEEAIAERDESSGTLKQLIFQSALKLSPPAPQTLDEARSWIQNVQSEVRILSQPDDPSIPSTKTARRILEFFMERDTVEQLGDCALRTLLDEVMPVLGMAQRNLYEEVATAKPAP